MKTCRVCGRTGRTTRFRPQRQRCRPCENAANREYRKVFPWKEDPGQKRARARVYKYGLTQAGFDSLLDDQGGRCAICHTDSPTGHGWQVDHDHATGDIRGILCPLCNTAIGKLKDSVENLERAKNYLLKKQPEPFTWIA